MPGVSVSALWASDADLAEKVHKQEHERRHVRGLRLVALAFSTLGVVYGDIGTSPLYVYGAVFPDGAPADEKRILGVASTIFWTLTSIVLVKYIIFTMQADDNGEGGIFALYALICRACNIRSGTRVTETDLSLTQYQAGQPKHGSRIAAALRSKLERSRVAQTVLLLVVLLASNMIISDGVLTPAISVVSAIEGIQFQTGISRGAITGISMGILVGLFMLQSIGTQRVSFLFSPAMLLWFIVNATLGIYNICRHGGPGIFRALSPHYMYYFWSGDASGAWKALGNVMLCVTGAEALYADMGHFNSLSIRLSFITVVYPSLVLTYLGQTAMIVQNPAAAAAAYWESVPSPVLWPVVVLATAAAIIASQALITGAFSIVQQAIAMNAFPRLTVRHTSTHIMGQVYIPEVNWLLLIGALVVVGIFQTSAKIGNAYGLAVITVMLLDTTLFVIVALTAWEWNVVAAGGFWVFFTFITGAFLSSNLSKVPKGAWFSLVLAFILSCITYLWHWGQKKKLQYIRDNKILLRDLYEVDPAGPNKAGDGGAVATWRGLLRPSSNSFAASSESGAQAAQPLQALRLTGTDRPVARVPGIGVYYNELLLGVPPVLERFMSLVPALHEVVIFLTVRTVPVPFVLPEERLLVRRLRFDGFYHVVARYGYMDEINHDHAFMDAVIEEIHEYLDPATGVLDLSAEAASRQAAATLGKDVQLSPIASEDVEKGLPAPAPGHVGRESSVQRSSVVHVDASESLTASAGRQMRSSLAVQLFDLRRSASLSVYSEPAGASGPSREGVRGGRPGGPRNLQRSTTITLAVPLVDENASLHGGGEGDKAEPQAPWVQMPSQVRRVRARMLGLPEKEALASPGSPTPAAADGDELHSLPLPPRPGRPPLPQLDSTKSLPLVRGQAGRRVPLYRVQRAMAAAAAETEAAPQQQVQAPPLSPPQATPTSTLTPAAAARLGQQLWQRLQQGRLQDRLQRLSADSRATGASGPADRQQSLPAAGETERHNLVPRSESVERRSQDGGRAETVLTEDMVGTEAAGQPMDSAAARRQLFQMQSNAGVAASQLEDRYAAERQLLLAARQRGIVFLLGRSSLRADPGSNWLKVLLLETLYGTLVANCRPTTRMYQIPRESLLSIGVDFQL
ncbi:hypothetical protein ABPG77_010391 [Micractinium sp. CCAP 211/92]